MRTVTGPDPAELGANLKGGFGGGPNHQLVGQWLFPGSLTRWYRWYIYIHIYISHPISSIYATSIPLIVLANWVIICYRSHLLREPGNSKLSWWLYITHLKNMLGSFPQVVINLKILFETPKQSRIVKNQSHHHRHGSVVPPHSPERHSNVQLAAQWRLVRRSPKIINVFVCSSDNPSMDCTLNAWWNVNGMGQTVRKTTIQIATNVRSPESPQNLHVAAVLHNDPGLGTPSSDSGYPRTSFWVGFTPAISGVTREQAKGGSLLRFACLRCWTKIRNLLPNGENVSKWWSNYHGIESVSPITNKNKSKCLGGGVLWW